MEAGWGEGGGGGTAGKVNVVVARVAARVVAVELRLAEGAPGMALGSTLTVTQAMAWLQPVELKG
jgi:hypothetical protein